MNGIRIDKINRLAKMEYIISIHLIEFRIKIAKTETLINFTNKF